MKDSVGIVESVSSQLGKLTGGRNERIKQKLIKVLRNNGGYERIKLICNFQNSNECEPNSGIDYSLAEISSFKHAPITSAEVERMFSQYKSVLRDNRRSFLIENLKKHLVIKCNSLE